MSQTLGDVARGAPKLQP